MPNATIEPARAADAATIADRRPAPVEPRPIRSATDDMPEEVVSLVRRGKLALRIRPANPDDLQAVLELISEAKLWLPGKYTDQWSTDWADQRGRKRSDRVRDSIKQKTTWVVTVTHGEQPYAVATVTVEPSGNPEIWTRPGDLNAPAVYLSRLVVARRFAWPRIGSAVLNWACSYARRERQEKWVRIDVWTRNFALHKYYLHQGFRRQGLCPDEKYPSRARFQRRARRSLYRRIHDEVRRVPAVEG